MTDETNTAASPPPKKGAYCYDSSREPVIPRKWVKKGILTFAEHWSIDKDGKPFPADDTPRFGWSDTEHEHKRYAFNDTGKRFACCHCENPIEVGDMYSEGDRFVAAGGDAFDSPYISGTDRIHVTCPLNFKRETTSGVVEEEPQDIKGVNVTTLPGYNKLTEDQKKKYLELVGMEVNEKNLAGTKKPLEDLVFVITGDVPNDLEYKIEQHGGKVAASVTKAVTHCIYGEATTKFGNKSGKGSKKYNQCKKKKLTLLTPEEAEELWTPKEDPKAAEEDSKAEEEQPKAKVSSAAKRRAIEDDSEPEDEAVAEKGGAKKKQKKEED